MTTVGGPDPRIAFPGSVAYAAATHVFDLSTPAEPAAAVVARTVGDIRAALRHADSEDLAVRVHTTGHSASTARSMHTGLLIRTELDGRVEIDPRARRARVPAGTRWGAVVDAAARYGLTAAHGSSPTVGVVGYLMRGGMSFYGRHVGVAANGIRAIELVTADGRLRRVDATDDPDTFWALRGGGGGFGIVTAVELDLFPAARVVTGAAFWSGAHAERLLSLWRQWTSDAPTEATTTLRVMNLPAVPEVPPVLVGEAVLCLDGAVLAATADDVPSALRTADRLLGPLRMLGEPLLDTWKLTSPAAVVHTHMDPPDPLAVHGDHMLLTEIGDAGAAEFLRVVGEGSDSPLISAELRQLGGAFARPDPAGGALDHYDARYAYMGGGIPGGPVTEESIRRHCATVRAALSPWDTGRTAPTFVADRQQPQGHLSPAQVEAVDRIRARIDPAGRFRDDIAPGTTTHS